MSGDLIAAFQYVKGAYKKARDVLLVRNCSDKFCSCRTRSNGCKLKEGNLWEEIVYSEGGETLEPVVQRSPRSCPDALSLEVFKARLDGALSNLVS